MKRFSFVVCAIAALAAASPVHAQALRGNAGFKVYSIPANDDGSSELEDMGFTINFFGKLRRAAYVNNNGNITFDSSLATFTPFGLARTQREIIAAFFADVDTRPTGSKLVTYGQDTINGHKAFGVNYVDVGYYNVHADKLNSFQLIVVDRSDTGPGNFDIEFNYARISWETGDASGGVNGYGGTPAAVGWSNGTNDPGASFELPGSLISGQFLDNGPRALVRSTINSAVLNGTSTAQPGRLTFRARDGVISPGLSISNGLQLPDATQGTPYSTVLAANGAKGPFKWSMVPDVMNPPGLSFAQNGLVSGTPTTPGTYSFTLAVTANTEDGELTAYQRGSITILPPSVRIVSACPLDDATVGRPYSVSLRASGSPSGYTWSVENPYSVPPGLGLSVAGQLAGTPMTAGTYIMGLRVRSTGSSDSQPGQLLCRINVQPAALRLSKGCTLTRGTVSVPYSQVLSADGGSGPYKFSLLGQLPLGLGLTEDGKIGGTPLTDGDYPFQLAIRDSVGGQLVQDCSVAVDAQTFNVASACPLPAATTGVTYSASLPGKYTWSLGGGSLPSGLSLSPDGSITGTPMAAGPARFTLIATDGLQQSGQPCTISVMRGPLSISGCPLPDASVGEPYSARISPLGGSSPYLLTVAGTLPEGISVSTDGAVNGTPLENGAFPFTILLREGAGGTTSQSCNLNIGRPALRIATACPLPSAQLADTYSAQIQAAGGTAPYRFEFGGFLPDGLRGGADGSVSGTPTALGGRTFTLKVTDGANNSVSGLCSVSVGSPKAPAIRLGDLQAVYAPAASNAAVVVELTQPYSAVVEGRVELNIQPETRSSEASANQSDPRLRFLNGQTVATFSLAPGVTRVSLPLASTGTVASLVTVSVTGLRVSGADLALSPAPKIFRIVPQAPVITSACYTRTTAGIEVQINGYSTTRELTRADVSAGNQVFITDIGGVAGAYFTAPESIRSGGTFSIKLPYELSIPATTPLTSVSMNLLNTVGSAGSRTIQACQ